MIRFLMLWTCVLGLLNAKGQCNEALLKNHVKYLTTLSNVRSANNFFILQEASIYLKKILQGYTLNTTEQVIEEKNHIYKNIISSFGPVNAPRLIIGANYDTFNKSPGADDNASGVAAILELARLLTSIEKSLSIRIDLVCYTLEQPPYFNTTQMGSYIHATSLKKSKADIIGMINIKNIGFFSDSKHSQKYPFTTMKWRYRTKGNFIAIVQQNRQTTWTKYMNKMLKQYAENLRVVSFKPAVPYVGMDFGSHKNYWAMGYNAIMITNTMFYRNINYHGVTDTYQTLDYKKMKQVVDMIYKTILYYKVA